MNILDICQQLTKEVPMNQIYINEPMSKHTTFKVGGKADIFIKIKNIKELKHVIAISDRNNVCLTIIGNGSNILVKDNGIRGIVVQTDFKGINIEKTAENNAIVTVGAGVNLANLAHVLQKNGITGFEFASGIPGTVGGAVKMNAGAYGSEMKDIVLSTKCLDLNKNNIPPRRTNIDDIEIVEPPKDPEIIELSNEEQKFTYRDSAFSDKKYIILETKLKLSYGNTDDIKNKMEEISKNRRERQPNLPSAGSTFKRGKDYITAKLIDECGLKGYTIGGAQVSEKHAGFIINTGNATAQDILDLIEYIKKVVYEKTGKNIDLEIEIIGE